jgi:hypothetical protein
MESGEEVMDEDDWDEASEWDDLPEWGDSELGENDAWYSSAAVRESLTPGERLMYALGQLFALAHRGQIAVAPADFDIEDLARIIGVWRHVEFTSDDAVGRSYHFPGEVLVVDELLPFPWRLVELDDWARLAQRADIEHG